MTTRYEVVRLGDAVVVDKYKLRANADARAAALNSLSGWAKFRVIEHIEHDWRDDAGLSSSSSTKRV